MCRLTELKKRAESVGEVVLDIFFDKEELAIEVVGLLGRGEFMPRFREGGAVNVKTQPMDLNGAMLSIMPEEFR